MAKLASGMIWSGLSLVASLLFCAAILLGPLATRNALPRSSGLGHGTQEIKLRAKGLEPVAGLDKAIYSFELSENAPVVRVSTGTR